MPTMLYLMRHGETSWNKERRLQGWEDSPLTEKGGLQAQKLAERLSDVAFDCIYSSDRGRAIQTAGILRQTRQIPVNTDEGLKEVGFGIWEGMEYQQIEKQYPREWKLFWNEPEKYVPVSGAEGFDTAVPRLTKALLSIISKNCGKAIGIVTHGAALKILMAHFEGRKLADLWKSTFMRETALNIVKIEENGKIEILLYADVSHLDESYNVTDVKGWLSEMNGD